MTESEVLSLSFNQDSSKLIIGHNYGFRVYETDSLELLIDRQLDGGVSIAEMCGSSNLFALRGGGLEPLAPATQVVLWDEELEKIVVNLEFKNRVTGIKLTTG